MQAELAEEQTRIAELNAELERERAEEARRIAEANAQVERERAAANAAIARANAETQSRFAEEQRRASQAALSANTSVANNAISETRRASEEATKAVVGISEEALERNSMHVQEVLNAGNENLTATLDFLEADEQADRKLFSDQFNFLGDTIEQANALSTTALTEAFKSTIGGFAEGQQKTLIYGLGIIAVLGAVAIWRSKA